VHFVFGTLLGWKRYPALGVVVFYQQMPLSVWFQEGKAYMQ